MTVRLVLAITASLPKLSPCAGSTSVARVQQQQGSSRAPLKGRRPLWLNVPSANLPHFLVVSEPTPCSRRRLDATLHPPCPTYPTAAPRRELLFPLLALDVALPAMFRNRCVLPALPPPLARAVACATDRLQGCATARTLLSPSDPSSPADTARRRTSQKPTDELYRNFRETFPQLNPGGTASDAPAPVSATLAEALDIGDHSR